MESRVLHQQLRDDWHARERAVPIHPIVIFAPEGLVLGAGTVLVPADGPRRLQSLRGREACVLALLSAAYGRAVAPSVLGQIERAMKAWGEGDPCLAYIHLAHAGLPPLDDSRAGAYRLFLASGAIEHHGSPRAVFAALRLDARYIDAVEKLYNPDQPRVPAGSGRTSGEWTDSEETGGDDGAETGTRGEATQESSAYSRMPPPAASFLGTLDAAQAAELALYASRLAIPVGGAAAVFGLLFIPSANNIHVEGEVPEIPGLRYSWNRDETVLHLTYGRVGGAQRTFALRIEDDLIRDDDGNVVGRVIGGNRIAIDTLAVLPDLVKQDEPRLCPAPAPDRPGSDQCKSDEESRSRQYENFVKRLINPPPSGPTPSGYVYYLPNPTDNGKLVSFDDCQKTSGTMFELKGESLAKLTKDLPNVMADDFVDQARRQVAASGGRPVVWIFAEQEAALFARKLFDETKGLEGITVGYVPWIRSGQ
jgi:hypothetical protein